jgi:hypothetical protein
MLNAIVFNKINTKTEQRDPSDQPLGARELKASFRKHLWGLEGRIEIF